MKIALVGYGNMGREIEQLIADSNVHDIVSISYRNRKEELATEEIKKADVAIDFTAPDIVLQNIESCMQIGVPLVVGTTGWYDKLDHVSRLVKKYRTGLIYGQNFSIGANIFFKVVTYATKMFDTYPSYDVFGIETHHTGKKDSPSGTARKLAEVILKHSSRKRTLQTARLDRQIKSDELHFVAARGGRNFGRHEIVFDSPADEIRLTHQAWGRRGFAEGALLAAEFIKNKKGIFNFSDIFAEEVVQK
jgi:4-hydroxy-tetrahydrodipicolinate reductase